MELHKNFEIFRLFRIAREEVNLPVREYWNSSGVARILVRLVMGDGLVSVQGVEPRVRRIFENFQQSS